MSASLRRGACPTLRAPMRTGDGLLARLAFNAGLTPRQLVAVAKAARVHGNGALDITARGGLQVRGLGEASADLFAADIESMALPTRGLPAIQTPPLAGFDASEIADPRPLARSLTAAIDAELAERLSPKLAIVIDGGGQWPLDDLNADIRLVASAPRRWRIATGGDGRTACPREIVEEDHAIEAALDLLRAIAARGREARGCDLPGGAGNIDAGLARPVARRAVGAFSLRDGAVAFAVAAPFGRVSADALIRLTEFSGMQGIREFRFAPARAIVAICDDDRTASDFARHAADLDFIVDPRDVRLSLIACVGSPDCASAHIDARAIAAHLGAHKDFSMAFPLHVSGCVKQCAGRDRAGLTLIGIENGCEARMGETSMIWPTRSTDDIMQRARARMASPGACAP